MGLFEKVYRVHPGIGMARVGNAGASEHFLGPEIPWSNQESDKKEYARQFAQSYKTKGKIRPQSVRFTIWEYRKLNQKPLREIHLDQKDVESISWYVHVANLKASFFHFFQYFGDIVPHPGSRRNKGKPEEWMIDPGARTISGRNMGDKDDFRFTERSSDDPTKERWIKNQPKADRYLGELRTDSKGRLIFIGGKGKSGFVQSKFKKLGNFSENEGWYDDVSDGYVFAFIKFKRSRTTIQALPAWVLVGPPDFAPEIRGAVTLYDLLVDMMVRSEDHASHKMLKNYPNLKAIADDFKSNGYTRLSTYKPSFHDDILPILERGESYRYTYALAFKAHGLLDLKNMQDSLNDNTAGMKPLREAIFKKLRPPGKKGDKHQTMPMMLGDSNGKGDDPFLSLTRTQYELMRRWAEGQFIVTKAPTAVEKPVSLDIASMENASGGAFNPGVDVGWQIRKTQIFGEPFRVDRSKPDPFIAPDMKDHLEPGHFTRNMALPWQADFEECRVDPDSNYPFWPAQRPIDVPGAKGMVPWFRNAKGKELFDMNIMAEKWFENGFLVRDPATGEFTEKERGKV